MQQDKPDDRSFKEKLADTSSLTYMAFGIGQTATSPLVFGHFGNHAFAWHGPLTLGFLILFGTLLRVPEVYAYIPVWLLAVIYRRLTADKEQVSFFQGRPFWRVRSDNLAVAMAAWLVGGIGLVLVGCGQRIGAILCISAACMVGRQAMDRMVIEARERHLSDAMKMQEQYVRRMK